MRPTLFLLFLFAVVSCKKHEDTIYDRLEGKWELRSGGGGYGNGTNYPPIIYPPGNGKMYVFKKRTFTECSGLGCGSGTYEVLNGSCLIFNGNNNSCRSFTLDGNKLTLFPDYQYERIE